MCKEDKEVLCRECEGKLLDPESWPPICESCRRQINHEDNVADRGDLGEWD